MKHTAYLTVPTLLLGAANGFFAESAMGAKLTWLATAPDMNQPGVIQE